MRSAQRTAYCLDYASYGQIEHSMLAISPANEGAALLISPDIHAADLRPHNNLDQSFSRQMQQVTTGDVATSVGPPQAFLMTANSAVPVADSIRSYFSDHPLTPPTYLGYIRANKRYADYYSQMKAFSSVDEPEINRLRPLAVKYEHICVVEQLVSSGTTLNYASKLLLQAGVRVVTALRGNWYEEAVSSNVNLEDLTSAHEPFMSKIGILARQGAETYTEHFTNIV